MEEAKESVKNFAKGIGKRIGKILLPVVLVIILITGAAYVVLKWTAEEAAAQTAKYLDSMKVNEDGTLTNDKKMQDLWDEMIKEGYPLDKYLKDYKELARLMKAELVTQFPDTRGEKEIEKPIDWEKVWNEPDETQGIIKFKRAYSDGNKRTMTYVDPATFQKYLEGYNVSGTDSAKNAALSHFTLQKTTSSGSSGGANAIAAGEGIMTDVSQAIVDAANPSRTPSPGENLCLNWVDNVYDNAGLSAKRESGAYQSWQANGISTDRTAIPVGAAVYGTGWLINGGHNPWGHVGIYIGGGKVVDNVSYIRTIDLDTWISQQESAGNSIDGKCGWLGWGWADGDRTRGTTQDPNLKQNNKKTDTSKNNEDSKDSKTETTETKTNTQGEGKFSDVSGDGFSQTYTASNGITYKDFKQYEGSYKDSTYWGGPMRSTGCGPTSVAILASGLLGNNYSPLDIANKMSFTGQEPLKTVMDEIGMDCEVTSNAAENLKSQLENGKVLIISVKDTTFSPGSHIMAVVDVKR